MSDEGQPGGGCGAGILAGWKTAGLPRQEKAGYEADQWKLMVVSTDASGTFTTKPWEVSNGGFKAVR